MRHFWHMGIVRPNGSIVPRRIMQRVRGKTYRADFDGDNGTVEVREDGTVCIYTDTAIANECTISVGVFSANERYEK